MDASLQTIQRQIQQQLEAGFERTLKLVKQRSESTRADGHTDYAVSSEVNGGFSRTTPRRAVVNTPRSVSSERPLSARTIPGGLHTAARARTRQKNPESAYSQPRRLAKRPTLDATQSVVNTPRNVDGTQYTVISDMMGATGELSPPPKPQADISYRSYDGGAHGQVVNVIAKSGEAVVAESDNQDSSVWTFRVPLSIHVVTDAPKGAATATLNDEHSAPPPQPLLIDQYHNEHEHPPHGDTGADYHRESAHMQRRSHSSGDVDAGHRPRRVPMRSHSACYDVELDPRYSCDSCCPALRAQLRDLNSSLTRDAIVNEMLTRYRCDAIGRRMREENEFDERMHAFETSMRTVESLVQHAHEEYLRAHRYFQDNATPRWRRYADPFMFPSSALHNITNELERLRSMVSAERKQVTKRLVAQQVGYCPRFRKANTKELCE